MVKTSITRVEPNKLVTKGYRQDELMGNVPYSHVIYLLLKGELPGKKEGKMIDTMLVSGIDHGLTPPTCLVARAIASSGVPLPTAVAGGLLSVGDWHGGAIENCMAILYDAVKRMKEESKSPEEMARILLGELKEKGKRMPGLGHRIHTDDPRTKRLFKLAKELEIAGDHVALLEAVKEHFEKKGKSLPINVDGALAGVACDMGFDHKLGKALFLLGRVGGLVAEAYEEMTRERPMRRMNIEEQEYDGPEERPLPEEYRE
ncbi:MAG: citryl-CoA lyase [Methanomassiliicoccales archaeon]|nr:MAG: citryl-CoA lyase [Methanomassiliicoccales archaeon]